MLNNKMSFEWNGGQLASGQLEQQSVSDVEQILLTHTKLLWQNNPDGHFPMKKQRLVQSPRKQAKPGRK
jgi:hypothetical protein